MSVTGGYCLYGYKCRGSGKGEEAGAIAWAMSGQNERNKIKLFKCVKSFYASAWKERCKQSHSGSNSVAF